MQSKVIWGSSRIPLADFFRHFTGEGHQSFLKNANVKIIDMLYGSGRQRERFWQYKLDTFAPQSPILGMLKHRMCGIYVMVSHFIVFSSNNLFIKFLFPFHKLYILLYLFVPVILLFRPACPF